MKKLNIIATLLACLAPTQFYMSAAGGGGSSGSSAAFDDILDGTLDDIDDLPSFSAWPAGAYRVLLPEGFKQKTINNKPAFELKMKFLELLELNNAADEEDVPKDGSETSVAFQLDNDFGKGFFKEAIKPFIEVLGLSADQKGAVRAGVESSKGLEVVAVMKRRVVTKDGEEKVYPTLVSLALL